MNQQPNQIFFKWDNGQDIATFQISGVKIQVAQFRKHIESQYNAKRDDFKIYHENKLLDISDEVRNSQLLNLVRTPKNRTNCLSCFNKEYSAITPCCQKYICSNCENVFCQKSKCFFNINPSCYFKYTENFQNVVPEPSCDEFITYNSIFYLIRTNKIVLANAKKHSVWSAREKTYLKLSQECNIPANVILIFINNDELVGLAKMINQLVVYEQQNPLFKTFKIHWLRQLPSFKKLYDFQIYDLREYLKLSFGLGKAMCYSFPIGQMNAENKLPQLEQQLSTSDAWDLDEIFKEEEETVKKIDECIKPQEQVSSFMQHCADEKQEQENNQENQQPEDKIISAVTNLAQIQELFNKINNGSIPGIKGDNKYIHPILSKLCLSLMSSQNDDSSDNQKLKKNKRSRSSSNRKINSKGRSKRRSSSSRDKKQNKDNKHEKSSRRSQKEKEKFRSSQREKIQPSRREKVQSSRREKENFHSSRKNQKILEKKHKFFDKVEWELERKKY